MSIRWSQMFRVRSRTCLKRRCAGDRDQPTSTTMDIYTVRQMHCICQGRARQAQKLSKRTHITSYLRPPPRSPPGSPLQVAAAAAHGVAMVRRSAIVWLSVMTVKSRVPVAALIMSRMYVMLSAAPDVSSHSHVPATEEWPQRAASM